MARDFQKRLQLKIVEWGREELCGKSELLERHPGLEDFGGLARLAVLDAVVGAALEVLVGILAGARIRLANLVCIAFDDI